MSTPHRIPIGGTIGVIGGGQLARMMALEARRMGYRVAVLDPTPNGPAAQVSDLSVVGAFTDYKAAKELAKASDVITLDTEHVPAELLEQLEPLVPVRPSAQVFRIVQDRMEQRKFLATQKLPQAKNAPVGDLETLRAAGRMVGFPAILKTRRSGYDGKGQARVNTPNDLEGAWTSLQKAPCVLEAFVEFEREISVILARDLHGNQRFYPIAENDHRRHILHTTRMPARVSPAMAAQAEALGARIATALNHVGVIAVELFVTRDQRLLVNEIAPRTHNSGHTTFGACVTSQFEQHVRAICGLPLGDPSLLRPAVMLNLLGDLWQRGEPDWNKVLQHPTASLHLYGKNEANVGRKMGHVLVLDGAQDAATIAEQIAKDLGA